MTLKTVLSSIPEMALLGPTLAQPAQAARTRGKGLKTKQRDLNAFATVMNPIIEWVKTKTVEAKK